MQVSSIQEGDLHALFQALPEVGLSLLFLDNYMLVSHLLPVNVDLHVFENAFGHLFSSVMEPIILRVIAPLFLTVFVVASHVREQVDELNTFVISNFIQLPREVMVYNIWVDLTPVSWAVNTW